MTTVIFDSLSYFEKLVKAGVPEQQAKVQAEAMREITLKQEEIFNKELATKTDLQDTKHEILKWLMGMLLAQTALILAVVALMK